MRKAPTRADDGDRGTVEMRDRTDGLRAGGAARRRAARTLAWLPVLAFGLIVAATWKYFATAWSSGQYVGGLSSLFIPVWPSKAIILVGAGAVAIQFAIRAVAALRGLLGS